MPGTPDADLAAREAWDLQTGSPSVVVAVVDNGQPRRFRGTAGIVDRRRFRGNAPGVHG
jgi:CubicO group peptidase (beta-lactamase class C family)